MKSFQAMPQGCGQGNWTSNCQSSEVAGSLCAVRGSDHPSVFDGPVWAHTSPVYVNVAGQRIASRQDAEYFVEWIEQMLKAVTARNRYASVDDRRQAEALFRRAQNEFGQMIKTIEKRPFARPKE